MEKNDRIRSVDVLRGLVMVVMALDHCRDFFGPTPFHPEDLSITTSAWFLTRWVTHFCAPVFVFLAGTSAWLYKTRTGRTKAELARFLASRGAWLIFVEIVVLGALLHFGGYPFFFLQVIWVIGLSMLLMSLLIWLPLGMIAVFGLALVGGHNLLDGWPESPWGGSQLLWQLLHVQGFAPTRPVPTIIAYPLIPWPGVMALGYCFGAILERTDQRRTQSCLTIGALCLVIFIVMRALNLYGEPNDWSIHERGFRYSAWSFLRTTKYPPSLLFLLMTLGPAIFLMPLFESAKGFLGRALEVFGRVPFFYYILHWFVIRAGSWLWLRWQHDTTDNLIFSDPETWPASYEPQLGFVYVTWLLVVALLYPLCKWYAALRSRHRDWWWLSYL